MLPFADLFPNLLPTVIVALGALLSLALEPILSIANKHRILPWVAFAFLVGSAISTMLLAMDPTRSMLILVLLVCGALGIAGLATQLPRTDFRGGEPYALMLLSLTGVMLMVQSVDLLALFVGMELSAIPIYALVGLHRQSTNANEGLFKYFITGSLFSAVFLYGAALWYGSTGSTSMSAEVVNGREALHLLGFAFVVFALLFKAGAAPLHFWVADTYTGASIPVTGFMSTTVKIGAFAGLGAFWLQVAAPSHFLDLGLPIQITGSLPLLSLWIFVAIGLASIVVGAFSGLGQTKARRLMAFSAVANAGYLVLALLIPGTSGASIGLSPLWFYLIAYALSSAIVLAGLSALAGTDEDDDSLGMLRGLGRQQPFLSAAITLGLISLAGLPPAAGFLAKFGILAGLFSTGLVKTAAVALLLAVVSFAYYFKIVVAIWQAPTKDIQPRSFPPILGVTLVIGVFALVAISLMPSLVGR